MTGAGNGKIWFVLGGNRSGKSRYALELAESAAPERIFIATAPSLDAEMGERIRLHRKEREQRDWQTIEAPLDPTRAVQEAGGSSVVLIDCITMWINNLLYEREKQNETIDEPEMTRQAETLLGACRSRTGTTVIVSNETGLGIIPATPLSRRFVDLAGRCNQTIAREADRVYFVAAGIPMEIK